MKHAFTLLALISVLFTGVAQKKIVKSINKEVSQKEYENHMYFVSSDEMRGRNTGTLENEITARYIAEQFRLNGVKMAPGADSYMQQVSLVKEVSPKKSTLQAGDSTFILEDDYVFYTSGNGSFDGEMVYAGYGLEEDLAGLDLKGKIVVAKAGNGTPGTRISTYTILKQELVAKAGGVGLVELFKPNRYPWKMIVYYFSGERYKIDTGEESSNFPSIWLKDDDGSLLDYFQNTDSLMGKLDISGMKNEKLKVPNVIGYIEGTDPKLRDEVIIISAHLDHVGVSPNEEDSIWNGARDNGIGISNMLVAAKYLSSHPPKRSIAFLACNAEEKGLLGSRWYADHPLIPMNKTIYNLNTDSGGYNDVSLVTVIGFGRTTMTQNLVKAAAAFGLKAIDDPLPEENFYDRSDNASFAAKGVPSVSFDPGLTAMDEAITKYYHQPADEANTLDFDYLIKYSKAYIYAVTLIANTAEPIWWTQGDKYEQAGQALYGKGE